MAAKLRLYSLIVLSLTIGGTSIYHLSDFEILSDKAKGRIVRVEKSFFSRVWIAKIFVGDKVLKLQIPDDDMALALMNYEEKYISVNYSEYLIGFAFKEKLRINSWQKVADIPKNGANSQALLLDKHLTCSFLGELSKNEELWSQIYKFLSSDKFDIERLRIECGV